MLGASEAMFGTCLRTAPLRGEAAGGLSIRSCPLLLKGCSVTVQLSQPALPLCHCAPAATGNPQGEETGVS